MKAIVATTIYLWHFKFKDKNMKNDIKLRIAVILGFLIMGSFSGIARGDWGDNFGGTAVDATIWTGCTELYDNGVNYDWWSVPTPGSWKLSDGNLVLDSTGSGNASTLTAHFPPVTFASDPNIFIKTRVKCLSSYLGLQLIVGGTNSFSTYLNAGLGWQTQFPPSGTGYLFSPFFMPGPDGDHRPTDDWFDVVIAISKAQTPYTIGLYVDGDLKILDDGDTNWLNSLTQISTVTISVDGVDMGEPNGWAFDYVHVTHDPAPVVQECGALGSYYAAGDVGGPVGVPDCRVDMYDFALLAEDWLRCSGPNPNCN